MKVKIEKNYIVKFTKKIAKIYFLKTLLFLKQVDQIWLKKKGIIVQDHVKIMPCVQISHGAKINIGAQIHHDCNIGKFATIAPKAVLLGKVKVGNYSYIGANSTIKQNIKIGKGAIIGAGSTVTRNVKDFDIVVGKPAKSIKTK